MITKYFFLFLLVMSAHASLALADNQADSRADNRPAYEMRNMSTSLNDFDVDYYSQPILLVRTAKTSAVHWVEFNVSAYEKYCTFWDNQCVQTDPQGRCVRWERVCRQWDFREYKIGKRIQLNLRKAPALAENEQEVYELSIHRFKPFDQGEDQVRTNLRAEKVGKPVLVRRWDDFSYDIEAK